MICPSCKGSGCSICQEVCYSLDDYPCETCKGEKMIFKENRKYIFLEKSVLSITLNIFFIACLISIISMFWRMPGEFRRGIFPAIMNLNDQTNKRIDKIEKKLLKTMEPNDNITYANASYDTTP